MSSLVGHIAWNAREADPMDKGDRSRRRVVIIGIREGRWDSSSLPGISTGIQNKSVWRTYS